MGEGYVFKGSGGSQMTSLLQQRCRDLLKNSKPGEGMLILLESRSRLIEWDRELRHIYPVEPRLCTFQGFVRQELEVYYHMAAAKGIGLAGSEVRPTFLDRDAALSLVSKVVQRRREKDGVFSSLSSTSERIASDILNSLDSAAMAGIPYDEVFDRLYMSLEVKNEIRRKIYKDAGGIACDYRKKCLGLDVLDTAASIELFCGCLLKDESYRALLKMKTRYLLADDLHNWDEAQLLTAELLLPGLKSYAFCYDTEALCRETNRLRRNRLIEDRLLSRCNISSIDIKKTDTDNLSAILHDVIASGKIRKAETTAKVERHPAAELRSEMLEQLGRRICELIEVEGVEPSDITILSTYADIVTELVLAGILHKRGHGLTNLAVGKKASGSRICRALLVFTVLCHPDFGIYPSKDDVRLLAEILFGLDPVKASTLARKVCSSIPFSELPGTDWPMLSEIMDGKLLENYLFVKAWTEENKNASQAEIPVFMQKALLEIFLRATVDESDVIEAKQLIDRAYEFCDIVSRFGMNAGKDFLNSAGHRMNVGESPQRVLEDSGSQNVILSTASVFLGSGLKSRVNVICGLGSDNWSPVCARELVNPEVLSAAWKTGEIYTAVHEEADKRLYFADLMRDIINSCDEKLITFDSILSGNGYENEGILPEIFDSIL